MLFLFSLQIFHCIFQMINMWHSQQENQHSYCQQLVFRLDQYRRYSCYQVFKGDYPNIHKSMIFYHDYMPQFLIYISITWLIFSHWYKIIVIKFDIVIMIDIIITVNILKCPMGLKGMTSGFEVNTLTHIALRCYVIILRKYL